MDAQFVAESGGLYLVSLDGSTDETARGVVYARDTRRLSHEASLASHLKMLHGYRPNTGDCVHELGERNPLGVIKAPRERPLVRLPGRR